jgi:hypothetical protein
MTKPKIEEQSHKPVFSTANMTELESHVLPPDILLIRDDINAEFFDPFGVKMPGYVLKQLVLASKSDSLATRSFHIEQARQKAHTSYLSKWSKGEIKIKDENAEPMPEDVKAQLRELNEKRRAEKRAEREAKEARQKQFDFDGEKKVAKKSKKPVFDDPETQKLVLTKYPWAIPGSFRQDPEKAGGTNLDIKCQRCGMTRTIHLADAFQVKFCTACKGK